MLYFYPEDFGAKGNGKDNDCIAIQSAIDKAEENGGGTVVLTSGKTYFSDSIRMKKNVELHLQKGSRLKATDNIEGYIRPCNMINDPKTALIGNPVTGKPSFVFIYGYEADGCTISGEGTIDANGHAFVERKDRYYVTGNFYPRPTVIYIEKSNNITFKDVTIVDAPFWTLHPAGCDDVLISHIRILNNLDVANSDGIDPDHCTNVRILGCHIECADDCICLKREMRNTVPAKILLFRTVLSFQLPPLLKSALRVWAIFEMLLSATVLFLEATEVFLYKFVTAVMLRMLHIPTVLSKPADFVLTGGARQSLS